MTSNLISKRRPSLRGDARIERTIKRFIQIIPDACRTIVKEIIIVVIKVFGGSIPIQSRKQTLLLRRCQSNFVLPN